MNFRDLLRSKSREIIEIFATPINIEAASHLHYASNEAGREHGPRSDYAAPLTDICISNVGTIP